MSPGTDCSNGARTQAVALGACWESIFVGLRFASLGMLPGGGKPGAGDGGGVAAVLELPIAGGGQRYRVRSG